MADLVLHALGVAGGSLALCQLPGRGGAYAEDLAFLRDYKPAIVLSLTSDAEMAAAGAERLGAHVREGGARWIHAPVSDFGVPGASFMEMWPQTCAQMLRSLDGKGRVLVHCNGGCGRSGMIALRLMVQAGEDAAQALQRLRRVRDCAIETDAQLRWAVTGELE